MCGASRKNEICFKNLEEALAECPETYRHIDLLCAGWPCQGASIAGKRQGFKDKRTGLWKEVARCLRLFKPKWFLGENVPGLLSVNEGRDFLQVITDLQEIGYGVAWRVFDSQYFGVAQRRRRVFIVGCFGEICPPEILFEQKRGNRNDKKVKKMGEKGLCISCKDGEKQDPTGETIVASTIGTSSNPDPNYGTHFVAQTIGTTPKGNTSFVWQDTYITEINPKRKRKITRASHKLDSVRGIVIGNAVTVQVAEWIGRRIIEYKKNNPAPEQS
jgi:DNA (cytosine-5)-methyltransferase 1